MPAAGVGNGAGVRVVGTGLPSVSPQTLAFGRFPRLGKSLRAGSLQHAPPQNSEIKALLAPGTPRLKTVPKCPGC